MALYLEFEVAPSHISMVDVNATLHVRVVEVCAAEVILFLKKYHSRRSSSCFDPLAVHSRKECGKRGSVMSISLVEFG